MFTLCSISAFFVSDDWINLMQSPATQLLKVAIGGGFPVSLGAHPNDRRRLQEYFIAAREAGFDWNQLEVEIRNCLALANTKPNDIDAQVARARKIFDQ